MLVIIGLIVGGIVVGQSLIAAATVKAQITQISKLNVATNTFRAKYNYLPGDIPDPDASSFGFQARGASPGQGDGNGLIQASFGAWGAQGYPKGDETIMCWADLSKAGLIEGSFTQATPTTFGNCTYQPIVESCLATFYPPAKLGAGNLYSFPTAGMMAGPPYIYGTATAIITFRFRRLRTLAGGRRRTDGRTL